MLTGKQCRAARALLGWSLEELAQYSGVAKNAIANFEKNLTSARQSSLKAIHKAFSENNVEFIGLSGVKEKEDTVELLYGENCLQKLWENIICSLGDTGGEIWITNVDEKRTVNKVSVDLYKHIDNLKKLNINEKLLSCEGDNFFLMPQDCYRWMPKEAFSMSTSTYIYDSKVAYQLWGDEVIILVHSAKANKAERERFMYMWDNAIIPTEAKSKTA